MTSRDCIGVAVVGLGVGKQHVQAVLGRSDCSLRAVYDYDSKLAEDVVGSISSARVANGFQDILDDPEIQAVVVASYDDDHFSQVVSALRAGKHVFVEKPLCRSLDELQIIKSTLDAADGGLALWSNLILRAAPLFQWLRTELRSGGLGQLYAVDGDYLYGRIEKIVDGWRSTVDDYSVVFGGGVHLVDMLLWLTGERPSVVTAASNRICTADTVFRYDDFVAATLEFDSGLVARITANFGCVHSHQHVLRLFGTEATFLYDDRGARMHRSRDADRICEEIGLSAHTGSKADLIPDFLSCISSGRSGVEETQTFLDSVSVCAAIDLARQSRHAVEVTYL